MLFFTLKGISFQVFAGAYLKIYWSLILVLVSYYCYSYPWHIWVVGGKTLNILRTSPGWLCRNPVCIRTKLAWIEKFRVFFMRVLTVFGVELCNFLYVKKMFSHPSPPPTESIDLFLIATIKFNPKANPTRGLGWVNSDTLCNEWFCKGIFHCLCPCVPGEFL